MGEQLKKSYTLQGLGCANCAAKIENEIKKLSEINEASVNFATKKLKVDVNEEIDLKKLEIKIIEIIKKIESDVQLVEESNLDSEVDDHNDKWKKIRLCIGFVIFLTAVTLKLSALIEFSLYFISYLLIGGEIVLRAVRNIIKGQIFDENSLMSIATIGAFAIGEFPEGVAVMLFYQIGELFQDLAVERSRKSITALMDIRPDFANLKIENDIKKVSPQEVNIGDVILVKPGEKIPLDGKVLDGNSMVDTSALTGESVPRTVHVGDEVLSGFINNNGLLTVEVTKEFGESTVAKILDLVQNASSKKATTEKFITKFARYYTPIVVGLALLIAVMPPLIVDGALFSQWIYRALVFLVISCPCALVISIPLGFFGGIGAASKSGILIKGSNYLEALNKIETVIFDKTGTLTKGIFKVTKIMPSDGVEEVELLRLAAYAESYSSHPIAISILNAYEEDIDKTKITKYEEISGHGIKIFIDGKQILAGNAKLMNTEKIIFNETDEVGTKIYVAADGRYLGYIVISDELKEDAKKTIELLKAVGVKKTVMLTGDNKIVGESIADILGIDKVYSELLPHQKVEKLEELDREKSKEGKIVFVGDGINDAPVLARADIGIAMGGLGSDAAIEASDVVIMNDQPSKIATAIQIARRTKVIVWQNIFFAFAVKLIVLALGAGGIATMWEAVFADVGVALLAVVNSMRVMNTKSR